MITWFLLACHGPEPVDAAPHPHLLVTDADRAALLARIDDPPYDLLLARIEETASRPPVVPDRDHWDHDAHGTNGQIAQAAAFLAWLRGDAVLAEKAIALLDQLPADFETNTTWDVNIRMPEPLIAHTNAVDLLLGTRFYGPADARAHGAVLTEITGAFYDRFVRDDGVRGLVLGTTQNNHAIRTAAAIGYVAIAFPDHPDAEEWADWAVSELAYLWGPDGRYVQADGGVSEGPFYYGFALAPSLAFFAAAERAIAPGRTFHTSCLNRSPVDPWLVTDCVDGAPFRFDNPLHDPRFHATVAWWVALRLPSGSCPPLADAYFNPLNGAALLTGFGGDGTTRWSWEHHTERPFETRHGLDLTIHHLVHVDPDVAPVEPSYTTRFLPDAGVAVFRSDWGPDAVWALLVAEHGAARKTVHDHVDGTSISLAAYGEYLLVDPGYYKPTETDNAVTAHAWAHNLVLIDGRGPPDKGLLTQFGDTDAFLEHTLDGDVLDYAEARTAYRDTEVVRAVTFARGRYLVVADRLTTTAASDREHRWRLGGYSGYAMGGLFDVRADGARWERPLAGVDVFLASTAPGLRVEEPPHDATGAPHVHQLALDRQVADHGVIDGVVTARAPWFLAVLAPYAVQGAGHAPLDVVRDVPADGVVAWTITGPFGTDVAVARAPGAPQEIVLRDDTTVSTDASFAWFGDDAALVRAGTRLTVDGRARISGNTEPVALIED